MNAPMVMLQSGTLSLNPKRKVIKAHEYSAYLQAEQVLEAAREEAARIVKDAERGYDEKLAQGYAQGLAEAKQDHAERLVDTVIATVDGLQALEERVIDIVMSSLRRILSTYDDYALTREVVAGALTTLRDTRIIKLRVAAHAAENVRQDLVNRSQHIAQLVEVVADPDMARGACVIETESGMVDASLESQLSLLKRAFTRRLLRER